MMVAKCIKVLLHMQSELTASRHQLDLLQQTLASSKQYFFLPLRADSRYPMRIWQGLLVYCTSDLEALSWRLHCYLRQLILNCFMGLLVLQQFPRRGPRLDFWRRLFRVETRVIRPSEGAFGKNNRCVYVDYHEPIADRFPGGFS